METSKRELWCTLIMFYLYSLNRLLYTSGELGHIANLNSTVCYKLARCLVCEWRLLRSLECILHNHWIVLHKIHVRQEPWKTHVQTAKMNTQIKQWLFITWLNHVNSITCEAKTLQTTERTHVLDSSAISTTNNRKNTHVLDSSTIITTIVQRRSNKPTVLR